MKFILSIIAVAAAFSVLAQAPIPNVPPKRGTNHQLAWDASSTPGVTYVVRRGVASGKYDEMVFVTGLTYTWSNAPSAMTNYYVVSAKLGADESEYSNELKIEPKPFIGKPDLKSAVPVTVWIERKGIDGTWAKVANVGTFYDLAEHSGESYRPGILVGAPVKMLPE